MRIMKRIFRDVFLCLTIILIGSCTGQDKSNNPNLLFHSLSPVRILVGEVYKDSLNCFKIASLNKGYKIVGAYFDCGKLESREYDAQKGKIKSCDKKLLVENDTVKIYVSYSKIGNINFGDITILLQNANNEKSYIDTTFSFEVKKSSK